MAIDIAAMTVQQKLDYAAATGSVLLTSGSVAAPIAYILLLLPTGYSRFILKTWDLQQDTYDTLGFAFSNDGGATAIIDGYGYLSSLADASDPSASIIINADIFPGDGVAGAMVTSEAFSGPSTGGFPGAFPNQEKITNVIYVAQDRMNAIRLCGAAEDGHIPILAGSYWLYGVPTP